MFVHYVTSNENYLFFDQVLVNAFCIIVDND